MEDHALNFPCIIKPVDASGSKGITVMYTAAEMRSALTRALHWSRSGCCITEEYIEGEQIHGDAYIKDGKLIFYYLGDHHFYTGSGNRVPVSTRWPARHTENVIASVVDQVEAIASHVGYTTGPLNIEARIPVSSGARFRRSANRRSSPAVKSITQTVWKASLVMVQGSETTGSERIGHFTILNIAA
jgi:carbamoylphosphate synthase large subunit